MRFDPKAEMARRLLRATLVVVGGIGLLIACETPIQPLPEDGGLATKPAYRLGDGDQIRVIVFSEPDLSGEFEVDDTGAVSLPLIGQVGAGGRTLREFEESIKEQLRQGYLKDPRVSVQVLNYRPFYIIGPSEPAWGIPLRQRHERAERDRTRRGLHPKGEHF